MKPVRMLSGTSDPLMFLAHVSISIRKPPPINRLAGSRYLLSAPTSSLPRCGMTRPIQPTVPAMQIDEAVRTVAQTMEIPLNFPTCTPSACASASPIASRLILHRRKSKIAIAISMTGVTASTLDALTFARLPIVQ